MKRLKSIVMAVIAVFVAASFALPAMPVSADGSSASLSIVPKKNYVIEPGKSQKDTLIIRNLDTANDLDLNLRVIDFTFTDEGGTPKLFLAADAPQTTWSLKPFLTIPKTVTIPKGSSKTVNITTAIPAGHGAGSYYSAIVYSTGAPDGGNVGLSASGVTLVFASVPGIVKEDLKLQKFGAYDTTKASKGANGYLFATAKEPQNIAYTLKNDSNVTEAPVGSITLKNVFFGKEQTINEVNPAGSLALIGQTRTFTACIKLASENVSLQGSTSQTNTCTSPGLWPGLYTAKLDLFYGQNGNQTQEILSNTSFWYLPWWFVIAVIILVAIVAYLIWRIVRFVRTKLNGGHSKLPSRKK